MHQLTVQHQSSHLIHHYQTANAAFNARLSDSPCLTSRTNDPTSRRARVPLPHKLSNKAARLAATAHVEQALAAKRPKQGTTRAVAAALNRGRPPYPAACRPTQSPLFFGIFFKKDFATQGAPQRRDVHTSGVPRGAPRAIRNGGSDANLTMCASLVSADARKRGSRPKKTTCV